MKTLPPKIQDNLITILEAARIALGDADTYEYIADELDLSDEALFEIRESVQSYLAEDYREGWSETHPNDPLDTATAVSCLNDKTPPRFDLTQEQLLNEAVLIAGEAIALAEAYSGGDSETCDELTLQLTALEERINNATNQQ